LLPNGECCTNHQQPFDRQGGFGPDEVTQFPTSLTASRPTILRH
jgi:hypothetical protein